VVVVVVWCAVDSLQKLGEEEIACLPVAAQRTRWASGQALRRPRKKYFLPYLNVHKHNLKEKVHKQMPKDF
jgi:hypothetical protein